MQNNTCKLLKQKQIGNKDTKIRIRDATEACPDNRIAKRLQNILPGETHNWVIDTNPISQQWTHSKRRINILWKTEIFAFGKHHQWYEKGTIRN